MVFLVQASCFNQDPIESLGLLKEMKTLIELCFLLCLVEGSEGMCYLMLCFLPIQFCMVEVLCYAISTCFTDRIPFLVVGRR